MLYHTLLFLLVSSIACGLPQQSKPQTNDTGKDQKLQKEATTQPEQRQQKALVPEPQSDKPQQDNPRNLPDSQQPVFPQLPYYLEPLSPYPDYDFLKKQQLYPRVQPQIVFYGPGGQGQPILINPGSPPGNFLVPHQPQPGPNIIIRDIPQRPVFVAGYPKPAHVPPIEKDAEEIPTNPAKIPPFPRPSVRKPEKLETFNEDSGNPEDAGFLAGPDRHPQLIPGNNLKPGHRFFILNGEDLFTTYPFQNNQVNLKYAQPEDLQLQLYQERQIIPQKEFDLNTIPVQAVLLRNAERNQVSNAQDLGIQQKLPENSISLNQAASPNEYFRSALPLNFGDIGNVETIGQFRFAPPNEPYLSLEGEDIENDSVVIDARGDGSVLADVNSASGSDALPATQKAPEPSTAQAAPGAIALAGPGGVAGAAPKATALVGRGGLAVSSPQATAVAGTRKSEAKNKKPTNKAK